MISDQVIITIIASASIVGFGYIQRGFIVMVIKTTIQLLVTDAIEREKQQKALIYEAQTVARSGGGNEEIKPVPKTTSEINKLEDKIANLQNDFGIMLPLFNKEMEHFQEEIIKFVELSRCPPELKEKCIEHFLEIKRAINGNLD